MAMLEKILLGKGDKHTCTIWSEKNIPVLYDQEKKEEEASKRYEGNFR